MGVLGRLWQRFATGNTGVGPAANPPAQRREAEHLLTDELTSGHKHQSPIAGMFDGSADTPSLPRMMVDIEAMLVHPRVSAALAVYKGGIAKLPVEVEDASSPEVAEFALTELARFWQRCRAPAQQSYEWGRIGGELIYSRDEGPLRVDRLQPFPGTTARALVRGPHLAGVRVPSQTVAQDLWAGHAMIPPKGFWYAHEPYRNRWYGRPQLYSAWRPWRRLAGRDGAEEIVDGGVYRFAFRPPVGRYPPEDQIPRSAWESQGRYLTNRDKMREFLELYKSGAPLALSSRRDEHGQYVWDMIPPESSLDVSGLIVYTDSLEKAISLGIGVFPEMIEASEVGSGWSGRAIPMVTFYIGQQGNAEALVDTWTRQIGLPLARWNYGPQAWFRLKVGDLLEALMKQASGAKDGMQGQQEPDAEAQGQRFATGHSPGDTWQGSSGRWFTMRADRRVVPAAAPGQEEAAAITKKESEEPRGRMGLLDRIKSGLADLGFLAKLKTKGPPYAEVQDLSPAERMDNSPPRNEFIKDMAENPERKQQWTTFAQANGMTAQEAQKKVVANLEKMIEPLQPHIRVDVLDGLHTVEAILDQGYKTQFHKGVQSKRALNDQKMRREVEEKSMGVPADAPPEARPAYTYLTDSKLPRNLEAVASYGDCVLKLRPDTKKRMSVSFGDSLMGGNNGRFIAGMPGELHHDCMDPEALGRGGMKITEDFEHFDQIHREYIEGHVHGGVATSDIESIEFPKYAPPTEAMQQKMKAAGINWSLH